jgi:sugar O-acyltransferase (sialic acid O-acetyltransferase NeuD family)
MKKKIVLVGGGDFAKKIVRLIDKIGEYEVLGYTDVKDKGNLFDVKYIGNDGMLQSVFNLNPRCYAVICIGGNMKVISIKEQLFVKLRTIGYRFPNLISPNAYVDNSVKYQEGLVVFDNAYIDFGVSIGSFSIINMNTTIGHDTIIGNFVTISPETITGGGTIIDDFTFLGMNSTTLPYVKIAKRCVLGAGSVVVKDIIEEGVYVGNPVKKLR